MSARKGRDFLAIGIDFGTTYSAASWASSHDGQAIHHVTGWPSPDERLKGESQIPTQIDLQTGAWGFLASKDGTTIRWLKLLLLKPGDLGDDVRESGYLNTMRQLLQVHEGATGCGIDELIADFFKQVWEHTIRDVERQITVGRQRLKVAVTVPASWPNYARETLLAATKEGIRGHRLSSQTKVTLLDEADAAATYSLYGMDMSPEVEINDTFLVCDCGGGMVDITGYSKSSSCSSTKVARITETKGKFCGGFLVDTSFENWSKRKLRTADGAFQNYVKHEWEYTIKRSFSGRNAREASIANAGNGGPEQLKIPKDSATQFFAKTYSGIRQLITDNSKAVENQCGKTPKKVFLVGGLGASPYLYSQLHSQFQNILQPSQAWSAVVTGAVIMLLNRQGAPALVGRHDRSAISTVATAQTYSPRPANSRGERAEVRQSNSTAKTESGPATSLNTFNAATPSSDDLWLRFQILRQGSQELMQGMEQMLRDREKEDKKHQDVQDVQEESIRLKEKIKALEQEATERSRNTTLIMEDNKRLESGLATQIRQNDTLMKENKRLESELAIQIHKNKLLHEQIKIQGGKSNIHNRGEGRNSSEEDDYGRRDPPARSRDSATTDQLKHIPSTQATQPKEGTQSPSIKNTSIIDRGILEVKPSWDILCGIQRLVG
ncbi:hypothetical protein QBC45DRAFT_486031 [Copromyces sp. CBS 386.78]|nr:hypothetical protein QBC45DRAFT_486031 [Copromyces sp. CBS 386.78]